MAKLARLWQDGKQCTRIESRNQSVAFKLRPIGGVPAWALIWTVACSSVNLLEAEDGYGCRTQVNRRRQQGQGREGSSSGGSSKSRKRIPEAALKKGSVVLWNPRKSEQEEGWVAAYIAE